MDADVLIIGRGPAGLQAGLHAARQKVSVAILGKPENSGLARAHIDNYFGFDSVVNGAELLEATEKKLREFGVTFIDSDAVELALSESGFKAKVENSASVSAKAVILTIGTKRTKLNVPGEDELVGKGVSYCVDCDAGFFKGKDVIIYGDGSAAVHGALVMIQYAAKTMLLWKDEEMDEPTLAELESSGIKVYKGKKIAEIKGGQLVSGVLLDDGSVLDAGGVFIELGAKGAMELAALLGVQMDADGFIAVNRKMETSVAGIYAAGDITGQPWQLAKAVGEGCVAGYYAGRVVKGKSLEK